MTIPGISIEMRPKPASLGRSFNRAADTLSRFLGRDVRTEFAQQLAALIVRRIRSEHRTGKGRSGSRFERYSAAYAKRKGVSRSAVDLTLSGALLDAMRGRIESEDIIIDFAGRHPTANTAAGTLMLWHQEGTKRGLPARPGFGFTEEESTKIASAMQDILEKVTLPAMLREVEGA